MKHVATVNWLCAGALPAPSTPTCNVPKAPVSYFEDTPMVLFEENGVIGTPLADEIPENNPDLMPEDFESFFDFLDDVNKEDD